ncbi:MAG: G8 domain-containing protein, partial [Nonlabens sp.]|uniref:G8 domain-containing protein n=1 Tax=Nonlabens sp. TaxID=1888209 RepID=UPI0035A71A99
MKQYYTNNTMFVITLIFSKIKKLEGFCSFGNSGKKTAFVFFLILMQTAVFGATITSTSTGGNWATSNTWVGGVVPTAADDVIIASGATVTVDTNIAAKTITINSDGIIVVSGDRTVTDIIGMVMNGDLTFGANNSTLTFPTNTSIIINSPGGIKAPADANCSANVAIYIGTLKLAACVGNSTIFSFNTFNTAGGTIISKPTSNAPVCSSGQLTLTAGYTGSKGSSLKYRWSIKDPNNSTITTAITEYPATGNPVYPINSPIVGTYEASLILSTIYGGITYESTKKIIVTVTGAPAITAITAPAALCSGGSLNPTAPTVTTNGSALSSKGWEMSTTSGNTYAALTVPYTVVLGDNGKNIRYTATNSCGTTTSNVVVLTVNPLPNNVSEGFTGGTICNGSTGILKFDADDTGFAGPYTIVYKIKDGTTSSTVDIPNTFSTSFNVAVKPIITTDYVLISITNAFGCMRTQGFGDATARITVNPTATLTGAVQAAPVCVGLGATINLTGLLASRTSTVTYTINGVGQTAVTGVEANGSGAASFTSAALTAANDSQTLQITGVTTTSSTPNCQATFTLDVTLRVNPTPTAPAFTQVNPTCTTPKGTIVVTAPGPAANVTYTVTGTAPVVAAVTQLSATFSNLSPGNYSLTTTNTTTGCISTPTNVTINTSSAVTTTWRGTGLGWDNGVPSVNKKIVFEATYNSLWDLTVPLGIIPGVIPACSCEVKANVPVTIATGHTLKVVNEVIVQPTGTLTFLNNASLVQVNNPDPTNMSKQNTGNIIYNRLVTGIKAK